MKRILSMTIALALVLSLATTAFATEGGEQPQEETPVVVSTLDDLQAAIAAAEDGDTIALSATIQFDGRSLVSDKDITLVRAENFSNSFFRFYNKAGQISGITIYDDMERIGAVSIENTNSADCEVTFSDCNFIGESNSFSFIINIFSGNVKFTNCSFESNKDSALNIGLNSIVVVDGCTFTDNETIMQGAAIKNAGSLELKNSVIKNNQAGIGGGVYSTGTLSITNCQFKDNASTDDKCADIYSSGTLTITDSQIDGEGYYEESTGEKVSLPLADYTSTAKLIYLTDEQAAEYFAPDPAPDEPDEGEPDNPAETPSEPPEQPDNGEDGDTPTEPEEPPTTPEHPQDKPDDSDDDYEPPVYRPVRPTKPPEPEPQPEPAPTLICNEAVIDTSRSVILLGYGDGLLHEGDPLTRAQLATIVYRLLDDDSIAMYDTDGAAQFKDVAPDAWCYRYVQTINRAGIVLGVGEGNYAPNGLVTWAQTITILSRFVEPQDFELQHIQYDGWAVDAVQTAVALGWITDSSEFDPDDIISRGALVQLVNGILEQYR